MENENEKYVVMEKQMHAAETPFKVLDSTPREFWGTNYAYWIKQKKEGGSQRPLLGRMKGEQFQVYEDGNWEDKDLWENYSEGVIDKDGQPVLNGKGNQRRILHFDNRKELLVEFEHPVSVERWDKDLGQKVTEEHQVLYVRFSKGLASKIAEQTEDPRNSDETFYVINYDKTKSPADQYSVKFHH